LIGGSPCQSFSFAGKRKGMATKCETEILTLEHYLELKEQGFEFEGQSYLFWEFIRIMKEVNPTYFLLENVIMSEEWRNVISNALNVLPIEINSNLVSAQNRRRLYWTNIPIPTNKLPQNKFLLFKDIVYKNDYKVFTDKRITRSKKMTKKGSYIQWDLYDKGHNSQQMRAYFADGKTCTLSKASGGLNICLDYEKDIYRKIHPIEAERLQTVPDNYTECVPDNKRFEMLGNGWTIDVISYIFEFIPDFYQNQNSN
jgi:DNA (cytosine-5)-methyltransferase 3A